MPFGILNRNKCQEEKGTKTYGQTDKHADRHTDRHAYSHTYKHTHARGFSQTRIIYTNSLINASIHKYIQTHAHIYRHTFTHIHTLSIY